MATIRTDRSMMILIPFGPKARVGRSDGETAAAADALKVMLVNAFRAQGQLDGLFDLEAIEVKVVDSLLVKEG